MRVSRVAVDVRTIICKCMRTQVPHVYYYILFLIYYMLNIAEARKKFLFIKIKISENFIQKKRKKEIKFVEDLEELDTYV